MDEASRGLEGEDIATSHWEDARHWLSIYADLLDFKRGILERVRHDVSKLPPAARKAAEADVLIIESQMAGYQKRFELWQRHLADLDGPLLDPQGRIIRYKGGEATLTLREFQLLELLLNHPFRYFTVSQILAQAWAHPDLFPEQVRSYVQRVRRVFVTLDIPCDIVNLPGRGYSLELRAKK